jgi:hypothetical protein
MAKPMAPDPAIGIWKLNLAKSTFGVVPPPRSYVVKAEAWEDGLKMSVDIVDDQGNETHPESAHKFDGNDYPLKGSPLADTVSAKRIDERNIEAVWKKNGRVVLTTKTVISADGATATQTRTAKDAQGRTLEDVLFVEKQ